MRWYSETNGQSTPERTTIHRSCRIVLCLLLASCSACTPSGGNGVASDDKGNAEERTSLAASTEENISPSGGSVVDDQPLTSPPIRFRWVKETGIDFVREDDMRGLCRIFESTGGGVGVIDYDRDGEMDLIFTGGCKVPEQLESTTPTCAIYRHEGELKFTDWTLDSRLVQSGYCQGVAVGDYDNDGFDDVYLTALGSNGLFYNLGDGTFVNLTDALGVNDERWSTSCAFADINLDGNLDLYVVNYLADSPHDPQLCLNSASPTGYEQCPPAKYEGVHDRLFLNDGQGGFDDISESCGLTQLKGKGLGLVISDLDNQGLPEIFVANDGQTNFLFRVSVEGEQLRLEDVGLESGVGLSGSGYAQASMGVAVGDYDRSGTLDMHITNFYGDSNTIYKNLGDLRFEDATRSTGIAGPSRPVLGWGTLMADFDGDGWLDLFVANGHVEDRRWNGRGEPFAMRPQIYRNLQNGKFEEVSRGSSPYFDAEWLGRGTVLADLNHDQMPDVVVSHQQATPAVLVNQSTSSAGHALRLVGTKSNRNGIGAKVWVRNESKDLVAYRELTAGTSFQSTGENFVPLSNGWLTVEIRWPSGGSTFFSAEGGGYPQTGGLLSGGVMVVEEFR